MKNICNLWPLNKGTIAAKFLVYISKDVLSEKSISLIHSKTGFTSKVTVYLGSEVLSLFITWSIGGGFQYVLKYNNPKNMHNKKCST